MIKDFFQAIKTLLEPGQIHQNEPMEKHTTFRIGGPAELFLTPGVSQLPELIELCKQHHVPYFVMGNGSNLLVGDGGIHGAVISLGKEYAGNCSIEIRNNRGYISVEAGAMLIGTSKQAAAEGLAGMEFASGIPGSVGGGLVMNAGAYGGEMKDILESVTVLTRDGNVETWDKERYAGSYRDSAVMRESAIVLSAVLMLRKDDPVSIQGRMNELTRKRVEKQPLEYPSAGSTFKRPEGHYAGKLIMDAGLKGYMVGGAQVSEKHCGFVINRNHATSADVIKLMEDVRDKVYKDFRVVLEPEVKMIGEF